MVYEKNIHLLNSTFKWLFDHRKIQKRKYLQMNEKKKQKRFIKWYLGKS